MRPNQLLSSIGNMISAAKFSCIVPDDNNVFMMCETISTFDWIGFLAMIGTVGATVVALAFGLHSLKISREARKAEIQAREAEREANRALRYEQIKDKITVLINELSTGLPSIPQHRYLDLTTECNLLSKNAKEGPQKETASMLYEMAAFTMAMAIEVDEILKKLRPISSHSEDAREQINVLSGFVKKGFEMIEQHSLVVNTVIRSWETLPAGEVEMKNIRASHAAVMDGLSFLHQQVTQRSEMLLPPQENGDVSGE